MSIYDPPLPPEEPSCPYCDYPLEDKGIGKLHDWVCINSLCEYSPYHYDKPDSEIDYKALKDENNKK